MTQKIKEEYVVNYLQHKTEMYDKSQCLDLQLKISRKISIGNQLNVEANPSLLECFVKKIFNCCGKT